MADEAEGPRSLARRQIENARHDGRLNRKDEAFVADFREQVDESLNVRLFAIMGLEELRGVGDREANRIGRQRDPSNIHDSESRHLNALYERSEMASAYVDTEHPHLNAITVVGLFAALDALVEGLVPSFQSAHREILTARLHALLSARTAIKAAVDADDAQSLEDLASSLLPEYGYTRKRPGGAGAQRWEAQLATARLDVGSHGFAVPEDLEQALRESKAVRDVVVHRASRLDSRAMRDAPSLAATLSIDSGDLVRINRQTFGVLASAIIAYGESVVSRVFARIGIVAVRDLSNWRDEGPLFY